MDEGQDTKMDKQMFEGDTGSCENYTGGPNVRRGGNKEGGI